MVDRVVIADAGWAGGPGLRHPIAVGATGQRITWVGAPRAAPPANQVLAVEGILLPGLVDHHVHTGLVDPRLLLPGGLTTVVDLGWTPEVIWPLAAHSADAADMPRIRSAGPFLTVAGGYPTQQSWAPSGIAWEITDAASAARAVRTLASHRLCTVKVALNTEAGHVIDDAALEAVVRTARSAGIPVTAHAQGPGQVERAINAGVSVLAHTPWTERLDDGVIAQLAGSVEIISTIDIHGWGADTAERRIALHNLRRFHAAGGTVRYGTDLGNGPLPAAVNPRELAALGDAGLAGLDILSAITGSRLAPGAVADLTVVPADPISDPSVLASAVPVLKAGSAVRPVADRDRGSG